MAKSFIIGIYLACVPFLPHAIGQEHLRECVQATYLSQVGIRELTGRNDGREVSAYLQSVGLTEGHAWCAAFVYWCFSQCGVKAPCSGWSPMWFSDKFTIYRRGVKNLHLVPKPGDVGGIWYKDKQRIAHVFFIHATEGNNFVTIEGNTNGAGSREGNGVYRKIRPANTVYAISRYIND